MDDQGIGERVRLKSHSAGNKQAIHYGSLKRVDSVINRARFYALYLHARGNAEQMERDWSLTEFICSSYFQSGLRVVVRGGVGKFTYVNPVASRRIGVDLERSRREFRAFLVTLTSVRSSFDSW